MAKGAARTALRRMAKARGGRPWDSLAERKTKMKHELRRIRLPTPSEVLKLSLRRARKPRPTPTPAPRGLRARRGLRATTPAS